MSLEGGKKRKEKVEKKPIGLTALIDRHLKIATAVAGLGGALGGAELATTAENSVASTPAIEFTQKNPEKEFKEQIFKNIHLMEARLAGDYNDKLNDRPRKLDSVEFGKIIDDMSHVAGQFNYYIVLGTSAPSLEEESILHKGYPAGFHVVTINGNVKQRVPDAHGNMQSVMHRETYRCAAQAITYKGSAYRVIDRHCIVDENFKALDEASWFYLPEGVGPDVAIKAIDLSKLPENLIPLKYDDAAAQESQNGTFILLNTINANGKHEIIGSFKVNVTEAMARILQSLFHLPPRIMKDIMGQYMFILPPWQGNRAAMDPSHKTFTLQGESSTWPIEAKSGRPEGPFSWALTRVGVCEINNSGLCQTLGFGTKKDDFTELLKTYVAMFPDKVKYGEIPPGWRSEIEISGGDKQTN